MKNNKEIKPYFSFLTGSSEAIHEILSPHWLEQGVLSMEKLRTDSTVVASNIAPPSDCHLLNDGIRVLSRLLAKSKDATGINIRFTDQRRSKRKVDANSGALQELNAKNNLSN